MNSMTYLLTKLAYHSGVLARVLFLKMRRALALFIPKMRRVLALLFFPIGEIYFSRGFFHYWKMKIGYC